MASDRYLEKIKSDKYKDWVREEYSVKKKKKDSDGSGSPASKYAYDFPVIKKKHKPIIPGDDPHYPPRYAPGDDYYNPYHPNPNDKHNKNRYTRSVEFYPYIYLPYVDKIDKDSK